MTKDKLQRVLRAIHKRIGSLRKPALSYGFSNIVQAGGGTTHTIEAILHELGHTMTLSPFAIKHVLFMWHDRPDFWMVDQRLVGLEGEIEANAIEILTVRELVSPSYAKTLEARCQAVLGGNDDPETRRSWPDVVRAMETPRCRARAKWLANFITKWQALMSTGE